MIIEASHEDEGVDFLVRISLDYVAELEKSCTSVWMNSCTNFFWSNIFGSGGTDYKIGRSRTQLTGLKSGHPETEAEQYRKIIWFL